MPRASEPRGSRNAPQDLRDYDDPPSSYTSRPVPRIPSHSQRRPPPISPRPPSPSDVSVGTTPSPRPRQALQSSSATVRPRAVPASPASKGLGTPEIATSQLASTSRLSVSTVLSEMRGNSTDYDNFSASRPSLDVPSSTPSINRTPSAVLAPADIRRSPSPASSYHSKPKSKPQPRGASVPLDQTQSRRDHNARISFFDPANQSALDRLIFRGSGTSDPDGEEEGTQDIMSNVEEMLEGYEWASEDILGRTRSRGAVDQIAARLQDELMALEKVFNSIIACNSNNKRPSIGKHPFFHRE